MGRLEYDDDNDDNDERGESEPRGRKRRRRFDPEADRDEHRQKRSGKRFHRRKTHKDESWPGDDPRGPSKRR